MEFLTFWGLVMSFLCGLIVIFCIFLYILDMTAGEMEAKTEIEIEYVDMCSMFKEIDHNQDNYICPLDLKLWMEKVYGIYLRKEEVADIIKKLDVQLETKMNFPKFYN